jgi:metallo-beta-lactamase family protein
MTATNAAQTSTITFCGGVGEVTGAHTVIDAGGTRFAVDCGLFQTGFGHEGEKNAEPFRVEPSTVQFLFITHAHADHIGRIALFVKRGFTGTIYSTSETRSLAELLMLDAVNIMKKREQEHSEKPLYDEVDVSASLELWKPIDFHEKIVFGAGTSNAQVQKIEATFVPIGHILGAGAVRFVREQPDGTKKVFVVSGDIGNSPDVLLPDAEPIADADYLVTESVYGDRLHGGGQNKTDKLREEITLADKRGGTLLIPSFAVHRTQSLLFEINNLFEESKAPIIPVYLDTPLGIKATAVYRKSLPLYNAAVQKKLSAGDDVFNFPKLSFVSNVRESEKIEHQPGAKVIIAGSGMSVGGRVLLHESGLLGDPNTTILFVGYQAPGTLGRRIQEGEKRVKIEKAWTNIRARVQTITGYSGHADKDQLLAYAAHSQKSLKKVFCIMGEPKCASFLAQRIVGELGVEAVVPTLGQSFEMEW